MMIPAIDLELKMENEDIAVSVVMLTYNHEKYVGKAIESVLAQKTEFRYELLIGDDCSSDKTRQVIEQYAEKYPEVIRAVYHDHNVGCTKNLVHMYKLARGKYIAHCEGDDYWTSTSKLQLQYDCLEADPGASAVTHQFEIISEDDKEINRSMSWIRFKKKFYARDFDGTVLPGQTSTLFQRNIFRDDNEKLKLFLENKHIGDRLSILLLIKEGYIIGLPQKMSAYRHRRKNGQDNITTKIYGSKFNGVIIDIQLFHAMCNYARLNNISYNLARHKQTVYVKAWLFLRIASREDRETVFRELGQSGITFDFVITVFIGIWHYVLKKMSDRIFKRMN